MVHMTVGAHNERQPPTACCNCTVGSAQERSTRWVAGSALWIHDCWTLHDALVRCTNLSTACHLLQGLDNLVGKKADGPKATLRVDEVSPPAVRCASVLQHTLHVEQGGHSLPCHFLIVYWTAASGNVGRAAGHRQERVAALPSGGTLGRQLRFNDC